MSRTVPLLASTRSVSPRPLSRVYAAVATVVGAIGREWRLQRDLHAVEGLDDRLLADIGIGPGQAESAVRFGRGATRRRDRGPVASEPRFTLGAGWTEWR